ncbi:hypothetical protein [Kaistella sp. SH11-4b]|nr:hypothetical protein [Kaistella sp. SH11-4b]MDP2454587.1 hypothetical protein [Kaistella sp. SH11-4b]
MTSQIKGMLYPYLCKTYYSFNNKKTFNEVSYLVTSTGFKPVTS